MSITVSKPNNISSPNGNSLALYKDADTGKYFVKDIYGKIFNFEEFIQDHGEYIVNGLVNNLASQGSGGFDFMEWTSNITGSDQIPIWRNPRELKLKRVTFSWMGETSLSIGAGEQVAFTIGFITPNTSSRIANYNEIASLFTIDVSDNGTFASREVTFDTPISLSAFQNLAIVGTETGTVTPNSGELSISLLLTR